MEKILISVVSMLAGTFIMLLLCDIMQQQHFHFLEPNDESPANVNAAKMWREDRQQFEQIADDLVRKTLQLPPRAPSTVNTKKN